MSLFFTLSGFLITSLLLREGDRIALGAFWARRARRLLPAATVALGGVVLFGATVASASQLRDLRGDVLGALGYVANWRFVLEGASYGDLWSAPSPVQHFWSLAIEEQLYVVLPLLLFAVRGRLRAAAMALGAALALSLLAAVLTAGDQMRMYYGTDVRAAELLAGALLAVAVVARPDLGRRSRVVPVVAPCLLAVMLVAWSTTAHVDGRLYAGGLQLHAVAVVVLIVAARRGGPVAAILSVGPLRWLGRVSYAAYLYHWPIFLWLSPERTGLDGVALAASRLGVSLVLAEVSTRLVEEPIRVGRWLSPGSARVLVGATTAAVLTSVVLVSSSTPTSEVPVLDVASAPVLVSPPTVLARSIPDVPLGDPDDPVQLAPGERLRVYVAGDSNAYILGTEMAAVGEDAGVDVWASGWFACHVLPGGTYRWGGVAKATEDKCNHWEPQRAKDVAAIRPHVIVVMYGSFDVLDRQLPGSETWQHVGEPAYDALLVRAIQRMTDVLRMSGARVLWTAYPHIRTGFVDGIPPREEFPESEWSRMDRFNTLVRQVVARTPGAGMLELSSHMRTWPGGELDPERRPDGLHPDDDVADDLAVWALDQVRRFALR